MTSHIFITLYIFSFLLLCYSFLFFYIHFYRKAFNFFIKTEKNLLKSLFMVILCCVFLGLFSFKLAPAISLGSIWPLNTSCLMKVDCRSESLIEKKHLIEINNYHRKLSLEKTLDYMQKVIVLRKKNKYFAFLLPIFILVLFVVLFFIKTIQEKQYFKTDDCFTKNKLYNQTRYITQLTKNTKPICYVSKRNMLTTKELLKKWICKKPQIYQNMYEVKHRNFATQTEWRARLRVKAPLKKWEEKPNFIAYDKMSGFRIMYSRDLSGFNHMVLANDAYQSDDYVLVYGSFTSSEKTIEGIIPKKISDYQFTLEKKPQYFLRYPKPRLLLKQETKVAKLDMFSLENKNKNTQVNCNLTEEKKKQKIF